MAGLYGEHDPWIVGETESEDGDGLIIRCRAALPSPEARKGWPHLILVGWSYEADDDSGMPPKKEDRQMEAFEDAVGAAVEASGAGVLAASLTGGGVREWRFYTLGPDAFMDALNTALDKHPEYPLEFDAFDDPEWNALAELLPPSA
jgi:hypothetical protein